MLWSKNVIKCSFLLDYYKVFASNKVEDLA